MSRDKDTLLLEQIYLEMSGDKSKLIEWIINGLELHTSGYYDLYPGYEKEIRSDVDYAFESKERFDQYVEEIEDHIDLPNEFLLYRALTLKDIKDFDKEYPGAHWSKYKESAQHFSKMSSMGNSYIVTGKATRDQVDFQRTVESYVQFTSMGDIESEWEITLKNDGYGTEIVSIEKFR